MFGYGFKQIDVLAQEIHLGYFGSVCESVYNIYFYYYNVLFIIRRESFVEFPVFVAFNFLNSQSRRISFEAFDLQVFGCCIIRPV